MSDFGEVKVVGWGTQPTGQNNDCYWNIAANLKGEDATNAEIAELSQQLQGYEKNKAELNAGDTVYIPLEQAVTLATEGADAAQSSYESANTAATTASTNQASMLAAYEYALSNATKEEDVLDSNNKPTGEKKQVPDQDAINAAYDAWKAAYDEEQAAQKDLEDAQNKLDAAQQELTEAKQALVDEGEATQKELDEIDEQISQIKEQIEQAKEEQAVIDQNQSAGKNLSDAGKAPDCSNGRNLQDAKDMANIALGATSTGVKDTQIETRGKDTYKTVTYADGTVKEVLVEESEDGKYNDVGDSVLYKDSKKSEIYSKTDEGNKERTNALLAFGVSNVISQYAAEKDLPGEEDKFMNIFDADKDGSVTVLDATFIQNNGISLAGVGSSNPSAGETPAATESPTTAETEPATEKPTEASTEKATEASTGQDEELKLPDNYVPYTSTEEDGNEIYSLTPESYTILLNGINRMNNNEEIDDTTKNNLLIIYKNCPNGGDVDLAARGTKDDNENLVYGSEIKGDDIKALGERIGAPKPKRL